MVLLSSQSQGPHCLEDVSKKAGIMTVASWQVAAAWPRTCACPPTPATLIHLHTFKLPLQALWLVVCPVYSMHTAASALFSGAQHNAYLHGAWYD
jgi:hypothetical protein